MFNPDACQQPGPRLLVLACLVSLGCGRIGYDPLAGNDGGGDDDGGTIDAAPAPDAGPFGMITPLASLNSNQTDSDPSLTADGLQLFFNSNRTLNFEIYVSVRATVSDSWPAPSIVGPGVVSTGSIEQNPVISADGLTLYFTRNSDIFQAKRSTPTGLFNSPTAIGELNTTSDTSGSITPDELAMTFFSSRSGGQGGADIYLATRPNVATPWSVEPIPGEVNSARAEVDSFLSADRLTLYFDSDRNGGLTDYNIYVAKRATPSDPFGTPVPVSELNVGAANGDSWHTSDGSRVYFSSGSFVNLDLHEATR